MTALAQEPWCFTPDQIARLTDWQIAEVYLRPAGDRAAARGTAGGGGAARPGGVAHCDRETAIRFMVEQQGKTPEQAAADYDRAAGR